MLEINVELLGYEDKNVNIIKHISTADPTSCIKEARKKNYTSADAEIINYQIGNPLSNETFIDMHLVNVDNLTIEEVARLITSANRFYEEVKDLMNIRKRPGRI